MSDRATESSRLSQGAPSPTLPRAPSRTGSEPLALPTATVESSVSAANSTEKRARSEPLSDRPRHTFDGKHGPVPPAQDTVSWMVRGRLVHYRAVRCASQPITEVGRLATAVPLDWNSWRAEIRSQRARRIGNNTNTAVANVHVMPSKEEESNTAQIDSSNLDDERVELERKGEEYERKISSLENSLRDTRAELQAANERCDFLQWELHRVDYDREQYQLERDHYQSERDRHRDQNRHLLVQLQTLRNQLTAAQALAAQPVIHQPPINAAPIIPPPAFQPPVAAHPVGPIRGSRRGRAGGARDRAARQGRGNSTAVREQPKRACKVERSYRI